MNHRPGNKKIILGLAGLLVLGGLLLAYVFISTPADGSITQPPKPQPVATNQVTVSGQYASFSYPSSFTATPIAKPVTPVVEAYSYVRHKTGSWEFSVQFTRLETGSLDDNGTYNYRNKTPSQFVKTTQTAAGQTATIFTDRTGSTFGKTAYLKKGTMSVSISLLGGQGQDGQAMQSVFDGIVASLHWK